MISVTWVVGSSMSMDVCPDVGLEGPWCAGTVGAAWLETTGNGLGGSAWAGAGMLGFGRNIEEFGIVLPAGLSAFTTALNGEGLMARD